MSNLIERYTNDIALAGSAGYVDKGVRLISETQPELVFLDVRLADGTGFDVLKKLPERDFELIFVTAYEEYAVDAIRASASDYLLKPIGIPEFEQAVSRVRAKICEKKKRLSFPDRKIGVATQAGYEFIETKDITWCTAEGSYTHFYMQGGLRMLSTRNLGFYEELLDAQYFFRIHHSTIINLRFLKSFIKGRNSFVVLMDGTKLEISQRRKAEFLDMFFPEK
ncbi:LytTR family two component transcriptional regulator [Dinghuibacter silviterrae]|uniref:LytTR family two component transcriptional regulator n=2 Tax=Dinghuibacter silviterrae TaxID=1539049 RepID=A0A4R8DWM3_9BACT|nr:LytTR family two component transcriptional regulator [Dinghuibacter silviterrae]